MRTPFLVDTSTSFDEYISRLAKTDKKKYKKNLKETGDYTFHHIPYDGGLLRHFIHLWSKQIVYKSFHPNWCYPMEYMDKIKTLKMFKVMKGFEAVGLHFIEHCDDYAYAHPPLYDKKNPELARYMWFNTIKWCCENNIDMLDLDGGSGRTWPALIKARRDFRNGGIFVHRTRYKWAYIPKDVKDNPDKEPEYYQLRCSCGWKQAGFNGDRCKGCGS